MFNQLSFLLLSALALMSVKRVEGQNSIYTTTLPWIDGNTVVISQSVSGIYTMAIETLSTIAGPSTTTPLVPGAATTTSRTSTGRRTTTTTPVVPGVETTTAMDPVTTTQRVVGQPEATDVISTTSWYWFTSDDGVVYSTYYSPSFTTALSATPAPSGNIQDYSAWQSSANSAMATNVNPALAGSNSSGAARRGNGAASLGAWGERIAWGAVVGVIGAVVGGVVVL